MDKKENFTFPVEGSASDIPVEDLLSKTDEEEAQITRAEVTPGDTDDYREKLEFGFNKKGEKNEKDKNKSYKTQFAQIYFVRITTLGPIVLKAAKNKWSNYKAKHVEKILNVKNDKLCYIVGTVYMEMQYKPNILAELIRDDWEPAPPIREKYCSNTDEFWLEDDSGRIRITGDRLKEEIIVSGMIMAVLGNLRGDFEVLDICIAGLPEQVNPMIRMDIDGSDDKYVALISGLNFGTSGISETRLQMMLEYFAGELGNVPEQQGISSKISRIIIAGNSLTVAKPVLDERKPKKYGYDNSSYDASPLNELDNFLERLCSLLPVHIMPGKNDPSNSALPQQPILRNLLPKAGRHQNFHSVTNPYWCEFDDVTFLGMSGQTIDDLYKYIEIEDRLIIAERTLHWRHMAPSVPDTLWCYPFKEFDPFIIDKMPHVYFIGNQKEFATSLVQGLDQQYTRIVLLPSFSESGIVALVNLNNLKCHTTYFPSTYF